MLLNPFRFGGGGGGGATIFFNTATSPAGITYSNGNLTMERSSGSTAVCSQLTASKSSGKYVVEFYMDLVNNGNTGVGLAQAWGTSGTTNNTDLGQETNEFAYRAEGSSYFASTYNGSFGATFTTGDRIMVCVDFSTKTIWFRKNGTNISGDPAAGTGGRVYTSSGAMYFSAQCNNTSKISVRATASTITTSIPSGFSPFDP